MTDADLDVAELPASDAQRALWLIDQVGQPSAVYTTSPAIRIHGGFDVEAARAAFGQLVLRHESLRTVFAWADGDLMQLIMEPPAIPVLDFAVEETGAGEVLDRAAELARVPFDLERGPLLRIRVLRVSADEHVLLVVVHHIVFDGWSETLLWREFAALYSARAAGGTADLPELPLQYADYAQWQRERLAGGQLAELAEYWRSKLAGVPPLELPTDRARPAVQAHRGAEHRFTLPAPLTSRLRALARAEHTTLFGVLLTAYRVLLGRYCRQTDLAIGVPFNNRTIPEVRGIIGLVVNDVAVRVGTGDDPAFRELVGRVRAEFLDSADHAELPFSRVVQELRPDRDLSRNPLFQAAFSLEEQSSDGIDLAGATITDLSLHRGASAFDLTLVFYDGSDGLSGFLEYDTDLFDTATAERMAGHYALLLQAAAGAPGTRVSALGFISGAERLELTHGCNDTAREFPRASTTAALFAQQVAAAGGEAAVLTERGGVSYEELDRRANRLAHHLRELGVGPEVPVGVCVQRSVEMLVAVLGVVKAGGAYLPLEPSHPADRLRHAVRDSGTRVVVTASGQAAAIPAGDAAIVDLEADALAISRHPAGAPVPLGDPENLAYIIYTSGSTGVPKGIGVSHRALARLVKGADYAELRRGDVYLQLSPLSFDASLLEIWGPLLNGGAVALPRGDLPFPENLRDALARFPLTTALLISPQLHRAAEAFPQEFSGLRQLLVGGDVLSPPHARKLSEHLERTRFVHVYGPTECTLFATAHVMDEVDVTRATVPLGRPIANTSAYVMDEAGALAPIGVPGELWLGGEGLARGYLRRPALTADRFVPDPFGPPGGRLYRTGDLVRRLRSGAIEFIGRTDGQIKLRGFRIETGEVESALEAHPRVREAVVTVRDDCPGGRALVAYLVPREPGRPVPGGRLREMLRSRLPEYMVPAATVWLDAIPLTVNGKVDRRALPAPLFGGDAPGGGTGNGDARSGAEPRTLTTTERRMLDIWRRVLGLAHIAPDSKFFELGGDSLLLAELFEQVTTAFPAVDFQLVELFEYTTCAQIAAVLDARGASPPRPEESSFDI